MSTSSPVNPLLMFSSDDVLVRGVQSALGPLGFQVTATHRTRELLDLLRRQPWGMLIIDAATAGEERAELIRTVRGTQPALAVLVLLAQRDLEFMADALKAGADDFATVPLQLAELKGRVLGRFGRPGAGVASPPPSPAAPRHDAALLEDLLRFHELSLQKLLEFEREVLELRDRVSEITSLYSESSGVGQRLLVVHPDAAIGDALRRAGRLHNMVVEQEFTGGGALDRLGEMEIDALICGAELPDLDGVTVAASLRAELPDVEAVLLTGWGSSEAHAIWLGEGEGRPEQRTIRNLDDIVALGGHFAERRARRRAQKQLARAFRERHAEFMRQYAETKVRLMRALGRSAP